MRKEILTACCVLAFGAAEADSRADRTDHPPVTRAEFDSAARQAALFERADQNNDGVIEEKEFRDAGLPREWDQWAGGEDQLDADAFYERAFDAYDQAAHAVRAFP
ncbi:MAG: hypothetical protein WD382_11415, partial [Halofilum sp. (in: g-proteobacteria)]